MPETFQEIGPANVCLGGKQLRPICLIKGLNAEPILKTMVNGRLDLRASVLFGQENVKFAAELKGQLSARCMRAHQRVLPVVSAFFAVLTDGTVVCVCPLSSDSW